VLHEESQPVGGGTTGPESLVLPSPNVPMLPSAPPLLDPPLEPPDELPPPSGTSKPFLLLPLPQAATTAETKTKAKAETLALAKEGRGRMAQTLAASRRSPVRNASHARSCVRLQSGMEIVTIAPQIQP
jgi:hypothetical protein